MRKPDSKDLKPLDLYEAELVTQIEPAHFGTPRFVVTHAHLSKEEARKVISFLQSELDKPGSVILPLIGRAV